MYEFQQMAAILYLAAGVGAILGLALPSRRVLRGARIGLALGAIAQGVAFATLHRLDNSPALTDLAAALAVVSWLSVLFLLGLQFRFRLPGFIPPVALAAFVATFIGSLARSPLVRDASASGTMPHAHVLLSSSGLAALGLAGLAGLFFLLEHRQLKSRRRRIRRIPLPSLEALDRVNRVALAVGFAMLTLGVVTGSLWLEARAGKIWSGSLHETWTVIAWIIYLGLVGLRFGAGQGGRQAAASAVAGFAFLVAAVLGSGLMA